MGFLRSSGRAFTSIINVRADQWAGLKTIKGHSDQIKTVFLSFTSVKKAENIESFDDAVQRLELDDSDIQIRKKEFTNLFFLYLLVTMLIFSYSIYLFFNDNWGGGLMSLCIMLYPLSLTFRFHFWLFQLNSKKLGCHLKDWWNN